MNPLMQGMLPAMGGLNPQAVQQVKQIMGTVLAMKNPQAALMQMAQQNPQISGVLQMVQGKNPQEVFQQQCKAHGLDPEEAIKQIKSVMNG